MIIIKWKVYYKLRKRGKQGKYRKPHKMLSKYEWKVYQKATADQTVFIAVKQLEVFNQIKSMVTVSRLYLDWKKNIIFFIQRRAKCGCCYCRYCIVLLIFFLRLLCMIIDRNSLDTKSKWGFHRINADSKAIPLIKRK